MIQGKGVASLLEISIDFAYIQVEGKIIKQNSHVSEIIKVANLVILVI